MFAKHAQCACMIKLCYTDHVVEIQMLQKVADDSKLCDILNELHHVDKHKSAETLLKAAKGTFNGSPNLFLVDKKVHSRVSRYRS